jgi:hypothetical protein
MEHTVIDVWAQHPTKTLLEQPFLESIRRWVGAENLPDQIPIEFTLGAMEAAGVDIALLSAWHGPSGELVSNDDVARIVDDHPERFRGVGSVDLTRPMKAVAEVERCVEELGFVGIRALPWLWDLPPNDRRFYPVYVACVEHDVPFCLQVGHTGPLCRSEPGRPIPYLDDVALDFPELTIVGGHIGYPWTHEMIALAIKYPNVYIDTSAYKPSRFPEPLVEYMRGHGNDKVLFGSNFPMITPKDALDQLDELDLSDEQVASFVGGNAREVFSLD